MNYRSIRAITILGALAAAPCVIAQTESTQSKPSLSAPHFETKLSDLHSIFPVRPAEASPFDPRPKSSVRFSKTRLVLLSAAVYGASFGRHASGAGGAE